METDQLEILSLINSNRSGLKRLIHLQFFIIIICLVGVIYLARKPPLVIRIDKLGNADSVANYQLEASTPTEDDVLHFTRRFLDDYIGLKSNLVVRQFETTLNMMTPELAKKHLAAMKEQNTVGVVQAAGIRNDINIQDVHSEVVGEEVYVKVRAVLETRPLGDLLASPATKPVVATLVLQKTKRSGETPYALIASGVQILVDQNGSQIEENLGEVIGAQ